MNNSVLVDRQIFVFADGALFLQRRGGELINEVKISVHELGGQRGEGAYFRRGLIFGRIW